MMGLLLAPAIFNGFPIIFADTGGYLLRPIEDSSNSAARPSTARFCLPG
jgi:hypothetical protein